MAASTSHDLWLCYQRYMDVHRQTQDPHIRNLILEDAHAFLDLWLKANQRELRPRAYEEASSVRQPALSRA